MLSKKMNIEKKNEIRELFSSSKKKKLYATQFKKKALKKNTLYKH